MEDDNQPLDPTQWDYNDLDFHTPQLSGIDSRGVSLTNSSPSPSFHQRPRLPLLQLDDWDPDGTYDESSPTCIHSSIEWKLQLRKGRLSKLTNDTEQNLVLAPGAFWETAFEAKVDKLLKQKTPQSKSCVPPSSNFGTASPSVVDLTDLVIPKPIDRTVYDYTEWLCDQVEDEHWKGGFRSAGSITKADCLDLRHVYQDRDIGYYVDQGVKAGIARSFVQDIKM